MKAWTSIAKWSLLTSGALIGLQLLKDAYYLGHLALESYTILTAFTILLVLYSGWLLIKKHLLQKKHIQTLLTPREFEVFQKLLEQKTNTQIAEELFIEESTLKSHINRIYKKLEVRNRREAIEKASTQYRTA